MKYELYFFYKTIIGCFIIPNLKGNELFDMTAQNHNDNIKNHLDNDKTKSAIMITAPRRMGKSFYINNCFVPFFMKTKKICVVSLYGLKET